MKKMRTISEVKEWLTHGEENSVFGSYLVSLDRPEQDSNTFRASVHLLDIAFEVFAQLERNGFDLDKDSIALGAFAKAYYQVKLREYDNY